MIKRFFILIFFFVSTANSEIIKEIQINGNDRISVETIKMFSEVSINDDISPNELNVLLKKLYETNFFEDVKVTFDKNILKIAVKENPIIQNVYINGIKSKDLDKEVNDSIKLTARSSYNKNLINLDKKIILEILKNKGYFFSEIELLVSDLGSNKLDITYEIKLNEKAKIKKITFIGPKIFKDRKLKNIILSEEYKFWKFLSGKKFLNENLIQYDRRLLNNFYLNKGYYNVMINSSFGKIIEDGEFELIYNINPGSKILFGDLQLKLPNDYDPKNFSEINDLFANLKGIPYSFIQIEKILNKIEDITIKEEFGSIKASVNEKIISDKINLTFSINELEASYISRINIFGNNVTEESVIRNQIVVDEGDPYNEILISKSINNIKSLNLFKTVEKKVEIIENGKDKIINITIEEKPTGEILAGAGYGTNGGTFNFSVKENNFLGKGITLDNEVTVSAESIKGKMYVINPNYKNSEKSVNFGLEATDNDYMSDYGYRNTKTGFSYGVDFEYLEDLNLGIANRNMYETIKVGSNASANQKKMAGDYFDSFLGLTFGYDKRNQRYETTDGFFSNYNVDVPLISDTKTFNNSYKYKTFTELYENNVSTLSFMINSSNSLTNKNIKLSERLFVPAKSLRGFKSGKIGPKDGADYIGGNYVSAVNITSTIPTLTENLQNIDLALFLDVANVWGVDYDASLDSNNDVRSSVGVGLDWLTPIGPMSFSLAAPITKSTEDKTENFRFNIGTSF